MLTCIIVQKKVLFQVSLVDRKSKVQVKNKNQHFNWNDFSLHHGHGANIDESRRAQMMLNFAGAGWGEFAKLDPCRTLCKTYSYHIQSRWVELSGEKSHSSLRTLLPPPAHSLKSGQGRSAPYRSRLKIQIPPAQHCAHASLCIYSCTHAVRACFLQERIQGHYPPFCLQNTIQDFHSLLLGYLTLANSWWTNVCEATRCNYVQMVLCGTDLSCFLLML